MIFLELVPQSSVQTPDTIASDLLLLSARDAELRAVLGKIISSVPAAGLTNRVFRTETSKGRFFVRVPGPSLAGTLDRIAEAHNMGLAAEIGLALPAVYCNPENGVLVTRAQEQESLAPSAFAKELGTQLAALHGSKLAFQGHLDPDRVLAAQIKGLGSIGDIVAKVPDLSEVLRFVENTMGPVNTDTLVPSHGDVLPGNCLTNSETLLFIDWEFSAMAHPLWDVAYAALEMSFTPSQEQIFLTSYRDATSQPASWTQQDLLFMKVRCDAISALWALENARDLYTYASERCSRAVRHIGQLSRPFA